ncbi:uncharacterized protein LOC141952067 [Strix uralensis]|uniref:uncharacterized protein LOC141952067 n=1 Tax=Strix uralensis TaxID=36305 RepID=UPI003DA7675C
MNFSSLAQVFLTTLQSPTCPSFNPLGAVPVAPGAILNHGYEQMWTVPRATSGAVPGSPVALAAGALQGRRCAAQSLSPWERGPWMLAARSMAAPLLSAALRGGRAFGTVAALCKRAATLGSMPSEEIDVDNLETLEKYRSFTRYFRLAEKESRKPPWWKTYRQHACPPPAQGRLEEGALWRRDGSAGRGEDARKFPQRARKERNQIPDAPEPCSERPGEAEQRGGGEGPRQEQEIAWARGNGGCRGPGRPRRRPLCPCGERRRAGGAGKAAGEQGKAGAARW